MAQTPAAGAKAPDFSLVVDDGGKVSLKDFRGKKLVLYFYPKADTPGCTREAIAFNGLKSAFAKADTAILGVSADPVKAQDAFKRKHKLAIPLASDESHKMLTDYGVWGEKSMYGRTFMGITRRDLPDRSGRPHRAGVAQGEGGRSRRRGARRREGVVIVTACKPSSKTLTPPFAQN
jgi:thioredoxin-dependent peroxiredoxin